MKKLSLALALSGLLLGVTAPAQSLTVERRAANYESPSAICGTIFSNDPISVETVKTGSAGAYELVNSALQYDVNGDPFTCDAFTLSGPVNGFRWDSVTFHAQKLGIITVPEAQYKGTHVLFDVNRDYDAGQREDLRTIVAQGPASWIGLGTPARATAVLTKEDAAFIGHPEYEGMTYNVEGIREVVVSLEVRESVKKRIRVEPTEEEIAAATATYKRTVKAIEAKAKKARSKVKASDASASEKRTKLALIEKQRKAALGKAKQQYGASTSVRYETEIRTVTHSYQDGTFLS